MTDSDFHQSLAHDRWASSLPRRTVCLQEAFGVFREDLYGLMMDKIGTSHAPDASGRGYWTDLLWRWKRWSENPGKLDIPRSKAFPIEEAVRRYGLEPNRAMMLTCPFHADRTPSMQLFIKTNTWYCFGACGRGGDVIAFVMAMQKCDFVTAVKALA